MRSTLLALCVFLMFAAPALARGVQTTIEPSHGPVEITRCRAGYLFGALSAAVDFTNHSSKTATAVRFYFRATDAFGQQFATNTPDRLGSFAPGVSIEDSHGVIATTVPSNVANVSCKVEMVRFADNSEWRAADAMPSLYYPPTPSPTESPLW